MRVTKENKLIIYVEETGEILAEHALCLHKKGELIRNNNHGRDRTKGVQEYIDHVAGQFTNVEQARCYLEEIRKRKSRYIRDQLQAIEKGVVKAGTEIASQALAYCLKYDLYRATDFVDAVSYFMEKKQQETASKPVQSDFKLLTQADTANLKMKAPIRDFETYQRILGGGNA